MRIRVALGRGDANRGEAHPRHPRGLMPLVISQLYALRLSGNATSNAIYMLITYVEHGYRQ